MERPLEPTPAVPGLRRISDAAREIGVSPSALRLWERQGLVAPRRPAGRERRYGPAEMERLHRVRRLRSVEGLNAAGIRRILDGPGPARRPHDAAGPAPLGPALRSLRARAGLSLREVAARTGLSASFVSGVERGTTGASVAALVRLAGAYRTTVGEVLGGGKAGGRVVRRQARPSVEAGRGVRIEDLARRAELLQPQLFVIAPGASSEGAYAHSGEEFMYILEGRLAVWLDEEECHELAEGDALTFASTIPHRFTAVGEAGARVLWVNTPPTF